MSSQKQLIANVWINTDRPTDLRFKDLNTWVIWQYPRKRGQWLCGAVRPPIPNHRWYPALVNPAECTVQVHAHSKDSFKTPEDALDWITTLKSG